MANFEIGTFKRNMLLGGGHVRTKEDLKRGELLTCEGFLCPPFAIHAAESIDEDGELTGWNWRVSHIATGCVCFDFLTLAKAGEFCKRAVSLVDWERPAEFSKEQKRIVKGLIIEIRDRERLSLIEDFNAR